MAQLYATAQVSHTKPKGAAAGPSSAAAPASASTVTLSAQAQSMASLNAMGVTIQTIRGPGLSQGAQPVAPPDGANGPLSQANFQQVLESYGATASKAHAVFESADKDHNGSMSNSEMLGVMDSTTNSASPTAQSLLQLMDTNHDGSVSGTEYVTMETSLVQANALDPGPTRGRT
jgi:EF-hand domain pair